MDELGQDARGWGNFNLLPGMSRPRRVFAGEHRIGDIEDSVQSRSQVPRNSRRRWTRTGMAEGHRTGKNVPVHRSADNQGGFLG